MATFEQASTRDALTSAIRENPGVTREQMITITALPSGVVDPARIRLWERGLIEPDSDRGWADALANRVKSVGWQFVEDLERRADVASRAATRTRRNAKPKAEERARKVVEALQDPTVARLVAQMTNDGQGSAKALRRADQSLRAQHMARLKDARQAEREKTANADFKRMLAHLWDARGSVGSIDRHLIAERARVANGERPRIQPEDWITALNDVRTIIKSFGTMWQNVRDLGADEEPCPACGARQIDEERQLKEFAVEADADEEVTDAEVVTP